MVERSGTKGYKIRLELHIARFPYACGCRVSPSGTYGA